MNKSAAIAIAIVVGLVAIAAPVTISVWWAWKQSLDEQMRQVASISSDVLRRSDESTAQVLQILRTLENAGATDPCSDASRRLMGRLDLESEQVQAIGYVRDNTLRCSSYGRHYTPVGEPAFRTPYGTAVRPSVEFPVLPGRKFLMVTQVASGYSAAIHPGLPLNVFVGEPDISIGVFSFQSKALIVGRGTFKPAWMEQLGRSNEASFADEDHLVVIRRSPEFAYAAFAAVPVASANRNLRRTAAVLVPIGILAGIVLALAVLHLAKQQLALPAVLKVALKRREFFLNYQPIIDLRTGACVGAEALIRWRRPNGEMVRPDAFVPVAEETGLIHEITRQVMAMVARDAAALLRRRPDLHIGINLSSIDLQMNDTAGMVRDLIRDMGVEPHNILVEATERGFMQADVARRIMDELHDMHVKIAIDDFGTGYSSLSYLEKFRLDYLKIDKSFVDTMGGEAATSQVAPHIIEMAKSLKLEMIAEGVETEAQAAFLRQRGVQYAQGWLFAKPMPIEDFAAFAERRAEARAAA